MLQNERISTPLYKKIFVVIISLFVFSIQLAVIAVAILGSFRGSSWLYLSGSILGLIVAAFILNSEMSSSYKLTWIVLILLMPLFFVVIYILNYNAKRLPKRKQKKLDNFYKNVEKIEQPLYTIPDSNMLAIAKLIKTESNYLLYKNTNLKFFNDAYLKHQDMVEKLKCAEKYIYMEYFIISDGELLSELLPILEEKGKSGVEIKILYDDIGSRRTFSSDSIEKLVNIPNLELSVYNPMGLDINPLINYRNHQKITIIDGKYAYCGGDNLADEYIHKKERFGFWRDNAMLFEGDAVNGFLVTFAFMWFQSSKNLINLRDKMIQTNIINNNFVIPFADGPYRDTRVGYDTFMYLIKSACKELYLSTPYLIIDDEMLNSIAMAKRSGVDVKILVPHIPDKKTVFSMTRAHYLKLLRSGCEIYEFTPGFNHAKNIIVDNKMAFIGTINMDYRSLFLHYECGAVISCEEEIEKMRLDFLDAVSKSELITLEKWNKRSLFGRFTSFLLKIFAPML